MGNIVKKTSCENPKKKEKLLKTADNSNRKAPALSRGKFLDPSISPLRAALRNYTPFLNFLLHQRTIGEQTHTEE